jgi:AcrR family transcriptional regulator
MATDATRDKLLSAATDAFVETGFSGARVELIARAAKANKAMIYYHFRDKEGLYQAVLLDLLAPVHEDVSRLAAVADPEARLKGFYEGMLQRFLKRPALARIMLHEVLAGGKNMQPETARAFSSIIGFVSQALAEGHAAGRFKAVHPMLFHLSVLAPILIMFAGADFRDRVLSSVVPALPQPSLPNLSEHVCDVIARLVVPHS